MILCKIKNEEAEILSLGIIVVSVKRLMLKFHNARTGLAFTKLFKSTFCSHSKLQHWKSHSTLIPLHLFLDKIIVQKHEFT